MQGYCARGVGPVEILESFAEDYLVRFDGARDVWASGNLVVGDKPAPFAVGERVLVAFPGGISYAGYVVGVDPGWQRVRAANGAEGWVTDAELLVSF